MDWLLRLGMGVLKLLFIMFRSICTCIYHNQLPSCPPMKNPLLKQSAGMLAKRIRLGEITSQAVVEAYIERIREVNPFLNAVIEDRFEAALMDAKACDEMLKAGEVTVFKLEKEKPLYGVPFTVKESISFKGLSQTGCSVVRRGIKSPAHPPAVEALLEAGGIPLCVTNTPEMCAGFDTDNRLHGRTENPYDRRRTAGGSSGGEGALLGAGASLLGIGSDLAGSIRVPSMFNGIFGHKPTPGIIPIKGHYPTCDDPNFQTYLTVGPMTRYAEDLHLLVKVMSSKCGKDLRLDEPVNIKGLRLMYIEELETGCFGSIPVVPEIKECVNKASNYLKDRGAIVHQLELNDFANITEISIGMFFGMKRFPQVLLNPNDPKHEKVAIAEFLKSIFGLSRYTKGTIFMKMLKDMNGCLLPSKVEQYRAEGNIVRQKLLNQLGDDGVLICPAYATVAPLRHVIVLQVISGVYCLFCNLFGIPSTSVPMGINKDGLPIGVQVIAAPNQDRLCLAVARELERGYGGWVPPESS